VVVVDDQAMVRRALRSWLECRPGIAVVGEAATGEAALPLVQRLRPDVVLLDLIMPGLGGVEAIRRMVRRGLDTCIFVLTSFASDLDVGPALDAGAVGVLSKDSEPEDLVRAIRRVSRRQGRREQDGSTGNTHEPQAVLAGR
jgi:DNA-binding NarL/FixJ family response regulator